MKKLFIFAIAALGMLACTEKNGLDNGNGSTNSKEISCDTYLIEFDVSQIVTKTITLTANGEWNASTTEDWITIEPMCGQGNAFVKITMIGGVPDEGYVMFSTSKASAKVTVKRIDKYPGSFAVGSNKKVYFSPGNLQYQASTKTWRFAEHQYDYEGRNNKNISASYSGWIDLFGWGTGNNPTLASVDDNDYQSFSDWGVNKISNGGNKVNQWRTLTSEEWTYLRSSRPNADNLRGLAKVNGVYGYVLFPDGANPTALGFTATSRNWTTNQYTTSQWAAMQTVGAVFLPAAGYRSGTNMHGLNDESAGYITATGNYWSATPNNTSGGACVSFEEQYGFSWYAYKRYCGLSVRLVKDLDVE